MKSVVYILVYAIIFPMSDSASQVSFSCDAENQGRLRGDPGPPGKRGPKGPAGPVGPKGGDADITSLIDDVRRLNNTVTELRRKLSLYPKIFHFRLPPERFTWIIAERFCESLQMLLCSRDEIFPFVNHTTVPYGIGILSGDKYAPIRDEENDWVQLASGHRFMQPGDRHHPTHPPASIPPIWGSTFIRPDLKGNIFCCLE